MTRLTWRAPGQRFFETGVDRGVLYPKNGIGVAWPGLISVTESPTGGESRPYYLDGVKYLNLSSAEEFEATINAFYSPAEFAPSDGILSIQNGLLATQQPRKPFGFCYRTRVGNEVEGPLHAYKIHLVYNALAGPSERNNNTMGSEAEANAFSWPITTLPPSVLGLKPTAHFVIDSRFTRGDILGRIESILYGSSASAPRMPLVSELIAIYKDEVADAGDADGIPVAFLDGGPAPTQPRNIIEGGSA